MRYTGGKGGYGMKIEIGAAIATLRHAKGVTQEALARAMGVSAPAVSKWETGQSYPDITLLPPLARFFGVSVDTLLDFSPVLEEAERSALCDDAGAVFRQSGWEEGLAACDALARQYPGDAQLRIYLASTLMECLVFARDDAQRAEGRLRQVQWLEEAMRSTEGKSQLMAKKLLGIFYLQMRRLDEAEAIFEDLLDITSGTRDLMPTLRLMQERYEDGARLAQENLVHELGAVMNTLLTLTMLSSRMQNPAQSVAWAQCARSLLRLFDAEGTALAHTAIQAELTAAHAAGNEQALLDAATQYTGLILDGPASLSKTIFDRIEPVERREEDAQQAAIRAHIAEGFETSEVYAPLRGDARFRALIDALREEPK